MMKEIRNELLGTIKIWIDFISSSIRNGIINVIAWDKPEASM